MTIKVAINGYGRIGRNVLRAHYEGGKKHDIQIVAINDLGDAADQRAPDSSTTPRTASSRARSRSTATAWSSTATGSSVVAERDPAKLPWGELGVDVVLECTGLFTTKAKAGAHLRPARRR